MLKTAFEWTAAGALAAIMMIASCAIAQDQVQQRTGAVISASGPALVADSSHSVASPSDTHSDTQWSPLGLDYAPEARCSDEQWRPHHRPAACNPQPGQACGSSLSSCPARCQKCYDDDLSFVQHNLKVNAITIYQPNYYILKAAKRLGMKVVVALLDDTVLGLASPTSQTQCTDGGSPLYLCGSNYAAGLLDGACIDTVGGDPFKTCVSHCSIRSAPKADCVNGDCSCTSNADCLGPSNQCRKGAFLMPLNSPASGEFLRDGTVIGIQMGNEIFEGCQLPEVPGKHQRCCEHTKTGRCYAWQINREVMSGAAQTMRAALDRRGLNKVKISVALVQEQGPKFCQGGAPPAGVDYIADHAYCDFMANLPPYWSTTDGTECWKQARGQEFTLDQKACGASRTYIGETGFNTGCPLTANQERMLKAENDFVAAMVKAEPTCNGQANPTPFPDFLFEYSDVGPAQGCLAGCGDPARCNPACCCSQHKCSPTVRCEPGCPACTGNGYFGLVRTPGYRTSGFPPELKLDPMPSLMCPATTN